jgi:hypothetical protein
MRLSQPCEASPAVALKSACEAGLAMYDAARDISSTHPSARAAEKALRGVLPSGTSPWILDRSREMPVVDSVTGSRPSKVSCCLQQHLLSRLHALGMCTKGPSFVEIQGVSPVKREIHFLIGCGGASTARFCILLWERCCGSGKSLPRLSSHRTQHATRPTAAHDDAPCPRARDRRPEHLDDAQRHLQGGDVLSHRRSGLASRPSADRPLAADRSGDRPHVLRPVRGGVGGAVRVAGRPGAARQ